MHFFAPANIMRLVEFKRGVDPVVTRLIENVSTEIGIERRPIDSDGLQRRFRAVMVNEGAKILAEGVAVRPLDIDMALIHGFCYPAWRGGPMTPRSAGAVGGFNKHGGPDLRPAGARTA